MILEALAESLDFSFHLLPVRDNKFGAKDAVSGEWSGAVRDVMDDLAEMAVSSFTVTKDRAEVVDFSSAVDRSAKGLFIGNTEVTQSYNELLTQCFQTLVSWTLFLDPMTSQAWPAVCLVSLLAAFTAFLIIRQSEDFTLANSLTLVVSALGLRRFHPST